MNIFYHEVTKIYLTILNSVEPKYCHFVTPEPPYSTISDISTHLFKETSGATTLTQFVLDGVNLALLVDSVSGKDLKKVDVLISLDFIYKSSVQTASSSELTVFTFYTDDVILCMQDFVFCVSALVSAEF